MLSPLAVEILQDLQIEARFEEGAHLTDLVEWLGESRPQIKAALAELLLAREAYRQGSRYFPGQAPIHGSKSYAPVIRMLDAGERNYAHIARVLNMSRKTVGEVARRHLRLSA
jgi:hypothetical protein